VENVSDPGGNRLRLSLSLVLAAVLLGTAFLMFGSGAFTGRARDPLPPDNPGASHHSGEVSVTAEPVAVREVQRALEVVGTLRGFEEVALSPKVEGRVLRIFHDVADRVGPGEPLLEIDPTDSDLAVRQAEKALGVELARLGLEQPPAGDCDLNKVPAVVQARTRMNNAQLRLERARQLLGQQAATAEEVTDKTAEFRSLQADFDGQVLVARAGLATIRMKQEALAAARQQRADTLVRTPVPTRPVPGAESAGVSYAITARAAAEGSYLKPGTEVFRLVIDRTLKLRAAVPERFGEEIHLGQKADVFAATSSKKAEGVVARINPSVDPGTRTLEVEIHVPNADGRLKPGGFAKTAILTRRDEAAVTVPLESLVRFAGVTKIFLLEDGKAREVQVTPGVQSTSWVEVALPSLPRGAVVVTSGQSALADGTPVKVRGLASTEESGQ
jgi:multidrug efflux pump subunit AcrA (membrane-fusion protein)